jgi:hypothetical protein
MKSQIMSMFLAIGAVATFGSTLHAQTYQMTADVPFAFQVHDQSFEPGKYQVRVSDSSIVPNLRNAATRRSIFVMGAYGVGGSRGESKLVFRCYNGETCFLAEIQPGKANGTILSQSKAEKELIKANGGRDVAMISVDLNRAD